MVPASVLVVDVVGLWAIKAATFVVVKRLWIVGLVIVAAVLGVLGRPDDASPQYFSAIAQVIPVLFIAGIVERGVTASSQKEVDVFEALQYGVTAAIGEASALAATAHVTNGHASAVLFWVTTLALVVFMASVVRRPVVENRAKLDSLVGERSEEIERLRAELKSR